MKSDYYEIYATVKMKYKVTFEEPVTFGEASQMFIDSEYSDVLDEEPIGVDSVDRVIQISYD